MQKDSAIEIKGLVKEYRLGQIDSGTLRGDLQSFFARLFKKDDPNIPLLNDQYYSIKNKTHRAIDGVDLTIKKGEAVGLIGINGAGKSTLLKLISRITLPTEGEISYRGRVTSLLEVGTGFSAELTGRENIYMNGAILGMSKEEITSKMDKIIEFSEIGEYIDTPVKRYSSGMYVKLAFAVAAHLDSEILLLDEILAVGDVKFQEKSLKRMDEAANQENKTVIYVSHNMATIRKFCKRCIVLDAGKIIYDGDVESAIEVYTEHKKKEHSADNDLSKLTHRFCPNELVRQVSLTRFKLENCEDCVVNDRKSFSFSVYCNSKKYIENAYFLATFADTANQAVATSFSEAINIKQGENKFSFTLDLSPLKVGTYSINGALVEKSSFDIFSNYDYVEQMCYIDIPQEKEGDFLWSKRYWGVVRLDNLKLGGGNND